jgi:myo-inositol-1-phosphate synthase
MKINVAIIGLGNVASALIQGIEYYKQEKKTPIGVLKEIKDYNCKDINFCLGIDVNKNKINKDLSKAIFIEPNCAIKLYQPKKLNAKVIKGPILDSLDSNIKLYVPVDENQKIDDIRETLKQKNIDVVVILLPTGANKAAIFYAKEALEAGCAIVNGMPALIANNKEIERIAINKKLPLIGDDVKSQIGATIIHRSLSNLFPMRGAIMDRTIQLDWGGDMDFCNLTSNNRYEAGKRQSKTESVIEGLPNKETVDCQISAVDYIPFLKNQKEAYTRIEGRIFGGLPMRIDITMQVQDGYNSAGIITDMIRVAKIGKDRKIGGVLHSAASFFNKKPPKQLDDDTAKKQLVEFINNKRKQ